MRVYIPAVYTIYIPISTDTGYEIQRWRLWEKVIKYRMLLWRKEIKRIGKHESKNIRIKINKTKKRKKSLYL